MTTLDAQLRRYFRALSLLICISATGCSQYIDPNVPEPIRPYVDPEFGRDYLFYRPSNYDRRFDWPLIVVCHTSFPDSPNRRIRAWTQLAESYGFLVAAPKLKGTRRLSPPKAAKQIALQHEDEKSILAAIRHIRAGHNVSNDRIFIHGWSGGAYAALYTGLQYPEIFRAIALSQPKFNESYLADLADTIDHYQPVLVNYNVADAITGKHARRGVEWMRSHGVNLTEDSSGMVRAADTKRPVAFFEDVIRRKPWIRIRALPGPGKHPLEIQFKLQCSYRPTRYQWDFGDGAASPIAEPVHLYAAPGTYLVTVTIDGPSGGQHRRIVNVTVPGGTLSTRNNTPQGSLRAYPNNDSEPHAE